MEASRSSHSRKRNRIPFSLVISERELSKEEEEELEEKADEEQSAKWAAMIRRGRRGK